MSFVSQHEDEGKLDAMWAHRRKLYHAAMQLRWTRMWAKLTTDASTKEMWNDYCCVLQPNWDESFEMLSIRTEDDEDRRLSKVAYRGQVTSEDRIKIRIHQIELWRAQLGHIPDWPPAHTTRGWISVKEDPCWKFFCLSTPDGDHKAEMPSRKARMWSDFVVTKWLEQLADASDFHLSNSPNADDGNTSVSSTIEHMEQPGMLD